MMEAKSIKLQGEYAIIQSELLADIACTPNLTDLDRRILIYLMPVASIAWPMPFKMSYANLADILGVSRVSISRAMSRILRCGFVKRVDKQSQMFWFPVVITRKTTHPPRREAVDWAVSLGDRSPNE